VPSIPPEQLHAAKPLKGCHLDRDGGWVMSSSSD